MNYVKNTKPLHNKKCHS